MARVSIIQGDADGAALLEEVLRGAGHDIRQLSSRLRMQAIADLQEHRADLVLVDLQLQDEYALHFLEAASSRLPGVPVIVVMSGGTAIEAVAALRAGAADFLFKPFVRKEILHVANKALAAARKVVEPAPGIESLRSKLLGESQAIARLRTLIAKTSSSNATVLIRGESGTGKELVARAVHEGSGRRDRAFIKIDCSSLPDSLLESELFGYEKGAFTGAVGAKPGRVELADGGTLFLDEIGEVSSAMQAKLLRLLQDREFEKLGGRRVRRIDVRFVLATHRDLEAMVENGTFRQDLFFRLHVVPIWLPPLRARRNDIELLARAFCDKFAAANGKQGLTISSSALRFLRSQRWPGNVRQLENFIERLVVLADAQSIERADVEQESVQKPRFVTQRTDAFTADHAAPSSRSPPQLEHAVRLAEREAVMRALKGARGNRSVAARALGVSRATLYNKMKELGLESG